MIWKYCKKSRVSSCFISFLLHFVFQTRILINNESQLRSTKFVYEESFSDFYLESIFLPKNMNDSPSQGVNDPLEFRVVNSILDKVYFK